MAKLNQVLAIEKGLKPKAYAEISELYKIVQKTDLFNGLSRQYVRKNDEDEELPAERKRVQVSTNEVIFRTERILSSLFQIEARKDWSNTLANASIVVDGIPILDSVPVTYLLFLEKQLTDIRTLYSNLPVLDDADEWKYDSDAGFYRTEPTVTNRTKKVQKPLVLYHATEQHAAQTQMITEDIVVGRWETVKQSGAIPKTVKEERLAKIDKLLSAVKEAREAANMAAEHDKVPSVGSVLFAYING